MIPGDAPLNVSSLNVDGGEFNINAPTTLDYLNFGGGTIDYDAYGGAENFPLTLNNGGQWSGGTLNLGAASLTNKGTFTLGTFTLAGSGTLHLNGTKLTNEGTIIQDGQFNLELDGSTNLDNQGSYTFQNNGTQDNVILSTNYGGKVTNEASGTITKADGTGNSFIESAMDNSGTLDVETGTLTFKPQNGAGYHGTFTGGTFKVAAADAKLDLTGGVDQLPLPTPAPTPARAPAPSRSTAAP